MEFFVSLYQFYAYNALISQLNTRENRHEYNPWL